GGVYVIGDAFQAAELASQVGRRTRARVISVDYRLAPEHPYPAAVDDALAAYQALLHDGTAPSDVVFAGESAGGGLAVATLVNARDHGLPLPAAALVMSPYAWPGRLPPPTSRSPSTSPPGCRTSSRPTTRSSTKRPRRWTEPDNSCRRTSPAQHAPPPSERQNARYPHSPEAAGSDPARAT